MKGGQMKVKQSVCRKESNLQPVARVGGQQRAAEHQDAAQHTLLAHLEREVGGVTEGWNNPEKDRGLAGKKEAAAGSGEGC